jgi:hypothetical protein
MVRGRYPGREFGILSDADTVSPSDADPDGHRRTLADINTDRANRDPVTNTWRAHRYTDPSARRAYRHTDPNTDQYPRSNSN